MLRMINPDRIGSATYTVTQALGDIQGFDTLFAPDDDIHAAMMTELNKAVALGAGVECHSSQFGFTLPDVATAFIALSKNAKSRFLFDRSQGAGKAEAPLIAQMRAGIPKGQMAVGTSRVAGQILHTKAIVLLYPDGTGWTMTGSWNISNSANEQFNIDDFIISRSRAELFASKIDAMFAWVAANEPQ
jgi:hypothetical protein